MNNTIIATSSCVCIFNLESTNIKVVREFMYIMDYYIMATPSCTSTSSLEVRNKKKVTIKGESNGVTKGAWSKEEDELLKKCIERFGEGKWSSVPSRAGLKRCRKSCRLRWLNYLSPAIYRGKFNDDEIDLIFRLHKLLGNRWSLIAGRIPGRTANDIKNFWNTHLSKEKLQVHDFPKNPNIECTINPHHVKINKMSNVEDDSRRTKVEDIYKPQPKRFSSTKNLNCWPGSNTMLQHKEPNVTTIKANECFLKDLMNEQNMSLDYELCMIDEALLLGVVNEWEQLLNS